MQALLAANAALAARLRRVEHQLAALQRVHDSLVDVIDDPTISPCFLCHCYGDEHAACAAPQCWTTLCEACRGPEPWRCPRCGLSNE
jgi:hypothetical protein